MSSERHNHCEQLKKDYVLDAIGLAQSFADIARRSLKSGDLMEAAKAKRHAEDFYSEAREMLWRLGDADASELVHPLAELRKRLDDVGRASRSASA